MSTGGTVGTGGATGGGGVGGCGPDEKLCFNICIPSVDPKFGCDDPSCAPCSTDHATPACVGGTCTVIKCDAGWENCDDDASNGCEVDTQTDPEQCGACGAPCVVPNAVAGCEGGVCIVGLCELGWSDCDADATNGCETDLEVDPENCGACDAGCALGEQCENGVCGVYCPPGQANCDGLAPNGCEVDLGTPENCGFCGEECTLANASGDCQAGECVVVGCDPDHADCDLVAANGCEVDLQTSAADCGACGVDCPSGPNSTAICTAGVCGLVCGGGYEDCNLDPIDGCEQPTLTDPSNCGGCDSLCVTPNATPGCAAGSCKIATCNPGFADCDLVVANGCEVDLGTTINHCGSCGTTCMAPANAAPTCTGGACGFTCNAGFGDCNGQAVDGCEVNLQTDPAHCGACAGLCNLADSTEGCVAGACTIATCDMGFGNCNALTPDGCEVNTQTSLANCGACAAACNLNNASEVCADGVCKIDACVSPFANCNGQAVDGCEINTDSSLANCGACGDPCAVANGTPACAAGQCLVSTCNMGFANCNNLASDGCEVNTQTNVVNCGACGAVCAPANGSPLCAAGTCDIGTCNAGFDDCDNAVANGCEVNLNTSVGNCGSCGNVCNLANASETCTGGACGIGTCNTGFGNCDGQTANGCETNLNSSVGNCGTCGNVCDLANSSETCANGACAVGMCNAGFGNCDGQTPNGCETNLSTAVGNCGICGNVCNLANANEGCAAGACTVASCEPGFGNCDGLAANGCETNLSTAVGNCGTCGNVCDLASANEACTNGVCGIATCQAGFDNCDGQTANGCEININANVNHCGSCGNVCNLANASEGCTGGACTVASCDAGSGNCDNLAANGCEISIATNVNHCGSCGNVCDLANANESCAGGVCGIGSCTAGSGNCDGNVANGCETNTNSSVGNCGTCGNVCDLANASESCTNGACAVATCDAGFANCDNNPVNGCEINTTNNASNCATCGNVCNLANAASSVCTNSACAVGTCAAGFGNCNGIATDGCETNLTNTVSSCGTCGNVCNLPNAVSGCSASACVVLACQTGFADCNGIAADGCEVNTTNSLGNCGICGNTCSASNGTATCSNSVCQVASCNAPWQNCNGVYGDGCEINTSNNVNNCNGCGSVCSPANANGQCVNSACQIGSCKAGFSNCNGTQADGCEINITADVQNCGVCGNNCAVQCAGNVSLSQCSGGACQIQACQGSYYNVDGQCSGGCECLASPVSKQCNAPISLGTVNVGQTITTSANLVPAGTDAWYTVTFTGNTNASYHPRVRFTSNPGNQFQFDIRVNCAGNSLACGLEGGVANAITDWETFFSNGPGGYYNPIPAVGSGGTVLIHVFRKAGQPLSCSPFTLQVSN